MSCKKLELALKSASDVEVATEAPRLRRPDNWYSVDEQCVP